MDERRLVRILAEMANRREIDIVKEDVVRGAMAMVVLRNRGLTPWVGRRKI